MLTRTVNTKPKEEYMPTFDQVPLQEAKLKTATGKTAQITKEYLGYIEQLPEGQAGRLQPVEGETLATVRRRLGVAAKLSDTVLLCASNMTRAL